MLLPADTAKAIDAGVSDAWDDEEEMRRRLNAGEISKIDLFGDRTFMDGDYLRRFLAANLGIYGNSKEEAVYPNYGNESRCFIDNQQEIADRSSRLDLIRNADGSTDIFFGPTAPSGMERNWIPTVPAKGWFTYFRLYAPTEPYFDCSWKLADIERVD